MGHYTAWLEHAMGRRGALMACVGDARCVGGAALHAAHATACVGCATPPFPVAAAWCLPASLPRWCEPGRLGSTCVFSACESGYTQLHVRLYLVCFFPRSPPSAEFLERVVLWKCVVAALEGLRRCPSLTEQWCVSPHRISISARFAAHHAGRYSGCM